MGSLGDRHSLCIEQGTGEIAPFFDIGGITGLAQYNAHLLCDGGKEMFKYFKANGVGLGNHLLGLKIPLDQHSG